LFDLSGKVAIVTGGSRGLGKEMAVALSEMGAKITITARREEWLAPTYKELQDEGSECLAVKADIAKPDDVQRIVAETLKLWGRVDILVNNAGMTWGTPPEDMALEKWDAVMNTNARGTLICCQQVGREMMRQGGGSIINIASTTGEMAVDPKIMQAIGYQASKAAIIVMTKQLAVEWAKHNIRVNAIAPFFFRTRMAEGVIARAESVMIQHVPMGRLANEGEMKGVVVFLASEASSYITGQVLNIDGGLSAW
jgi:gluconate 5-dehydrogenase